MRSTVNRSLLSRSFGFRSAISFSVTCSDGQMPILVAPEIVSRYPVSRSTRAWIADVMTPEGIPITSSSAAMAVPSHLSWPEAGGFPEAFSTAYDALFTQCGLSLGERVLVTGAAGGVGTIAVQLARRAGATVIGLASEPHHAWLTAHGVIPVSYGDGVADRIRQAAGQVSAFIDTVGADYVRMAVEDLGVEPSRVDTIANFEAVEKYGVKAEGSAAGSSVAILAELAGLIAAGELEVPITATFPLAEVQDAYRRLDQGHVLGKIVLTV